MTKNITQVKSYVNQDEYDHISKQAALAGLSISTFINRVCLGEIVKSTVDQEAILALVKCRADLGPLGGLLKQYLSGDSNELISKNEAKDLLKSIEINQQRLSLKFMEISQTLLKGNK